MRPNLNRLKRARSLTVLNREVERACTYAQTNFDQTLIYMTAADCRERIARRRSRKATRRSRKAEKACCVAIYDCDRQYGGPEEGGWWYDTGSLVEVCATFYNRDHAYAYSREIAVPICERANEGKPDIGSVICEGVWQAHVESVPAPSYYPQERPHYE